MRKQAFLDDGPFHNALVEVLDGYLMRVVIQAAYPDFHYRRSRRC
jgi:hypothetical protein